MRVNDCSLNPRRVHSLVLTLFDGVYIPSFSHCNRSFFLFFLRATFFLNQVPSAGLGLEALLAFMFLDDGMWVGGLS